MLNIKKTILISTLFSLFLIPSVSAACDYETQVTLQREAANITAKYESALYGTGEFEIAEGENSEGGHDETEIMEPKIVSSIFNLTENLYVTVENKLTGEIKEYHYKDSDNGTITWDRLDLEDIIEYEIKVYSDHSDCSGTELNKMSLITPKFNSYSNEFYCEEIDAYYCQKFITMDINMTEEQIIEDIENKKQKESEEEQETHEKSDFWQQYGIYIAIGVVLIGVVTSVIIVRKQRKKII